MFDIDDQPVDRAPRIPIAGKHDFWTTDRLKVLRGLVKAQTHSAREIAEVLGCSKSCVVGRVWRLRRDGEKLEWQHGKNGGNTTAKRARPRRQPPKPKSVRPSKPIPAKRLPAEAFLSESQHLVSIFDLALGDCRWPYGGDLSPVTYCGEKAQDDSSYCEAHRRMSVQGRGAV